jgi:hypothetical protein
MGWEYSVSFFLILGLVVLVVTGIVAALVFLAAAILRGRRSATRSPSVPSSRGT